MANLAAKAAMAKGDFVPDLPSILFKVQSAKPAAKAAKAARIGVVTADC